MEMFCILNIFVKTASFLKKIRQNIPQILEKTKFGFTFKKIEAVMVWRGSLAGTDMLYL